MQEKELHENPSTDLSPGPCSNTASAISNVKINITSATAQANGSGRRMETSESELTASRSRFDNMEVEDVEDAGEVGIPADEEKSKKRPRGGALSNSGGSNGRGKRGKGGLSSKGPSRLVLCCEDQQVICELCRLWVDRDVRAACGCGVGVGVHNCDTSSDPSPV